mmetsp:Transcript_11494/g.13114  ORF Transcript_11494/g.13114 Transcript_11494/m.13114 type:complete len:161 (+) Transcript_11494:59-541(+)
MTFMKQYALVSGFIGASASCLAKLSFDPNSPIPSSAKLFCKENVHIFRELIDGNLSSKAIAFFDEDKFCFGVSIIPRIICLALMITMNALMIKTFLRGMNESGSAVATALSTASNFSASAIYGICLFRESVNVQWSVGFFMILCGVWVLSSINVRKEKRG